MAVSSKRVRTLRIGGLHFGSLSKPPTKGTNSSKGTARIRWGVHSLKKMGDSKERPASPYGGTIAVWKPLLKEHQKKNHKLWSSCKGEPIGKSHSSGTPNKKERKTQQQQNHRTTHTHTKQTTQTTVQKKEEEEKQIN